MSLLKEDLIKIAKENAYYYRYNYDYIPTDKEQLEKEFIPHEWVIEAMYDAYSLGKFKVISE